jgi:uroporphyrinogen III methyltransferase/synthase
VTFTSSSTVKNFAYALGGLPLPASVLVACIGPSTAKTAEEVLGRAPDILAAEPTMDGFVAALEQYYAGKEYRLKMPTPIYIGQQ